MCRTTASANTQKSKRLLSPMEKLFARNSAVNWFSFRFPSVSFAILFFLFANRTTCVFENERAHSEFGGHTIYSLSFAIRIIYAMGRYGIRHSARSLFLFLPITSHYSNLMLHSECDRRAKANQIIRELGKAFMLAPLRSGHFICVYRSSARLSSSECIVWTYMMLFWQIKSIFGANISDRKRLQSSISNVNCVNMLPNGRASTRRSRQVVSKLASHRCARNCF